MVEQVVAALSGFRQAARDANDNVRQLLSGIMPSASRANESSKELRDTARASAQSDSDTRSASNKAASVAEETASLGEQILNELKEFSKKFTTLISGEGGSFVDSIFGMGLGGVSLAGGYNIDELDVNQDTTVNTSYSNPETGFESVEINGINFAPGAITSPYSEGAHNETRIYASQQNIDTTVNMFSQMQGQFGGPLTVNDFIPKANTDRSPPSSEGGSMHWYGKAMDISTASMNDKDKLRLVEAALTSGFKGFGFGNNILHVDWGGSRAWGYRNGVWTTSDLKSLEYGGMPVDQLASWVSGGQKPEEVLTALEASPLSEPTSEPPPSAAEDEMALDTPQAQETNDVTQVARNDVETNAQQPAEITRASFSNLETSGISEKPTIQSAALDIFPIVNSPPLVELQSSEIPPVSLAMADAKVETVKQKKRTLRSAPSVDINSPSVAKLQSSEIPPVSLAMADAKVETVKQETQTFQSAPAVDLSSQENNYKTKSSLESSIASSPSVAKLQSSEIPTVSLAMANAGVETVNFERAELELPRVDLTPATTSPSQTAALSGANISSPVVTQAVSYVAPQESSVVPTGLPNTKKPKPLVVNFETDWIAIANGNKRETNKTWMA